MMCDAVEASSRSLKEFTEGSIKELVNRIIDGHLLWEALKTLGHTTVYVHRADHLSEAEIETFRIAHHALLEIGSLKS